MRQIYSPLDGFRSPFGRLMGSTAPFTPSALFALSEPGVWYDPSDVANLAWRRNLFRYSQDFTNGVWTKSGTATVTTGQTDPLGGTTAAKIEFASIFQTHGQSYTFSGGETITHSVWLRGDAAGTIRLTDASGGVWNKQVSISTAWQRFDVTATNVAAGPRVVAISTASGDLTTVYVAFQQLELGSVATDYQKITDVNTEVIERFPSATLYQDTAGTQPVTTPGQTVALALDKSKGLVLGSELVGTLTAYANASISTSSGVTTITCTSNGSYGINLGFSGAVGKTYVVSFTVISNSASRGVFAWSSIASSIALAAGTTTGAKSGTLQATAGGTAVIAILGATAGETFSVSNISVKELPGFHATQATLASRPTYGIVPLGGRRNLLTRTEEFNDAVWTVANVASANPTVSANQMTAPDGSQTADLVTFGTIDAAGDASIIRQLSGLQTNTQQTGSVYLKAANAGQVGKRVYVYVNDTGAIRQYASVVLTTSWQRISVTGTYGANDRNFSIATSGSGNFDGLGSNADTNAAVLIWGAQLETGSSATAYQRVGSAFDVTEAGVASLSYLSFDGVDDFMVTPTITPGIDKAQVFAGVRKLSNTPTGVLVEHSANLNTNNGSFVFALPVDVSPTGRSSFRNKGTTAVEVFYASAAPVSEVISGIGDISGDFVSVRANGVQIDQSTADQGTGNYLAYPLYIGRRGGTTLPFNGNIFSLIVRFGTNLDAGTITSTETWVNQRTGAYT